MVNADAVMVFGLYRQTTERISALVTGLNAAACTCSARATAMSSNSVRALQLSRGKQEPRR